VARNLVVIAEATHARLRPRIAMSGHNPDAIEQACNLAIRHQSGQLTHERDRVVRNAGIVPTGCIQPLLDLQLSMVAALPVQDGMNDRAVAARPPVTTPAFLTLWRLASLGDLPDLDRLEEAGLLGKAPLPEELRGALGITGDDEDEDRAASAADDDGEADGDYAGLRWAEE